MKKKRPQKNEDRNLYSLLKAIQNDINVLKNDVKMIKVDYVLKDSQQGLSLRGLTREIEQTNKEVKKLQSDMDNLITHVVELDGKIEDATQAMREEAEQYHDSLATKLDSIAGKIKKFDEEHDILTYRQTNHNRRIEKLETSVFGKPSE